MTMEPSVLDDVIRRLLEVRAKPGRQVQLSESEVRQLCFVSKHIFLQQPNLLELEAPFTVCGDIHGQYSDLLRLFEYGGFPPQVNYLFMGNYVDYGEQSLETMCLLLAYKIKYPQNFFLLRGNHEIASINRIYGFYDECKRRYNVRLWKVFVECFNCLPTAALIDDKILCVHGGLSPDLHNLDQIKELPRPTDVQESGLLCDLLFSDPCSDIQGWGMNDRGVSYAFGADKVTEFLIRHYLDLICRSNQVVEDGYEFFANRQIVTVFSAPNFRGEYDNASAMMRIDHKLKCSFQTLKPAEKKSKFNRASTNSSKFPSGRFGSSASPKPRNTSNGLDNITEDPSDIRTNVAKPVRSRRGPSVGSTSTVKPENERTGVKPSSNGTSIRKPGSTPTDVHTGTAASTQARRYSSPGGARALGEYVGQSAKAVTRAVSPFTLCLEKELEVGLGENYNRYKTLKYGSRRSISLLKILLFSEIKLNLIFYIFL